MMELILMIILAVVIAIVLVIYPRKDTFVDEFTLKGTLRSFELKICTKQKSDPPCKSDRSNLK